jgi:DNA (cytosine-5)-methyltransferase 1
MHHHQQSKLSGSPRTDDWPDVPAFEPASGPEDVRALACSLGRDLALGLDSALKRPVLPGPIDVVDLFCGCGGLSAGFDAVSRVTSSYRLAGAADIAPDAIDTYGDNLPVRPLNLDLGEASASERSLDDLVEALNLAPGAPLFLIGGPPCQGFSAHRKREVGLADPRNDLVAAYARVAERLAPDFIALENVPELLSKRHWPHFLHFRESLEALGYHVRAQIHNLAEFGVPQERFRALVVASRREFAMPVGFLAPHEFRTVREAIGHLPPVRAGEALPSDRMHHSANHKQSTIDTIRCVPADGGRRPIGKGPGCLDRVDGFRDVYGRMYWERPANTITAYARNPASGRYVHPDQHRGLTVREAALLQGFPSSFDFSGSFDSKFSQIGNAVPPVFAAFVAAHLLGEYYIGRKYDEPIVDPFGSTLDVCEPTSNSFSSGIAGRKKRSSGRAA